ncbi:bifunctional NUDIX hydrolase/phosphatase PAP2 family protein [Veronia pacifica]
MVSRLSLLLFFTAIFISLPVMSGNDTSPKGAVCLVADSNGRVLMAKDYLTGRFAMPGGGIDDNETPEQAALRELYEETGLKGRIINRLDADGEAAIFNCQTLSPIPTYEMDGKGYVASWFSPHFGREIKAVYLLPTHYYPPSDFRFPKQVDAFPIWLQDSKPSQLNVTQHFSELATPFLAEHAQLNRYVQESVNSLPETIASVTDTFIRWASGFGSTYLYVLLVPFALLTGGAKRLVSTALMAVITILSVYGLKLFFGVPRPLYLFPDLGLSAANGFSFPSGHTTNAFAIWLTVSSWFSTTRSYRWILLLALSAAALTALSRVYLGVHYVMDIIAGAGLGTLIFLSCQKMANLSVLKWGSIFNPITWITLLAIILPIAIMQPQPMFALASTICVAMAVSLLLARKLVTSATLNSPPTLSASLFSLLTSAALAASAMWFTLHNSSSVENLMVLVLTTFVGGLVMVYPTIRFTR